MGLVFANVRANVRINSIENLIRFVKYFFPENHPFGG
jgi:hypothetical protein